MKCAGDLHDRVSNRDEQRTHIGDLGSILDCIIIPEQLDKEIRYGRDHKKTGISCCFSLGGSAYTVYVGTIGLIDNQPVNISLASSMLVQIETAGSLPQSMLSGKGIELSGEICLCDKLTGIPLRNGLPS